jgi:hypothetical protein
MFWKVKEYDMETFLKKYTYPHKEPFYYSEKVLNTILAICISLLIIIATVFIVVYKKQQNRLREQTNRIEIQVTNSK